MPCDNCDFFELCAENGRCFRKVLSNFVEDPLDDDTAGEFEQKEVKMPDVSADHALSKKEKDFFKKIING